MKHRTRKTRDRKPPRGAFALALTSGILLLGALTVDLGADDTNLVRANTASPFVFFIMDTSSSMNLAIADGSPLPLDGDDPGSRIYQAKQVLYEVLVDETNVHYGFATYNQDDLRVWSKHWLYRPESIADRPLTWPAERDFPFPTLDDQMVFGPPLFDIESVGGERKFALGDAIEPGACQEPLDLVNDRARINRYGKLGNPGSEGTTSLWVEAKNTTYRLDFSPATLDDQVGDATLGVDLTLFEVLDCTGPLLSPLGTLTMSLSLRDQFLMHDGPFQHPDAVGDSGGETIGDPDLWPWQDAFALDTNGVVSGNNNSTEPFTGKGFEPNYDGAFGDAGLAADRPSDLLDPFCIVPADNIRKCLNLKRPTFRHPDVNAPEVDRGDFLPWDWSADFRDEFLSRLNPNHNSGPNDFGIASYFQDLPDSTFGTLPLKASVPPPLVAFGESPLARAINDFRCWYNGTANDNKCRAGDRPYDQGWRFVARDHDDLAACRRPFLIIISDGEDTGAGENASADVGNLRTKTSDPADPTDPNSPNLAGVQTWVFNLGSEDNCKGNGELNSIANQGKPKRSKVQNCITVNSNASLETELRRVLGLIEEEARSFASAAVPSVQTDEGDKIFLTQFRPLQNKAVWDGHVFGFLKPIPLAEDDPATAEEEPRVPLFDTPCGADGADPQSACFLWDAGERLVDQAKNGKRRIFYARSRTSTGLAEGGEWPRLREEFVDPRPEGSESVPVGEDPIAPTIEELDLWEAMEIVPAADEDGTDPVTSARNELSTIIDNTLAVKTHTFEGTGEVIEYVLGDIFHSNPLVVGSPSNNRFFIQNPGYREFARKHQTRRRVLIFGANDGMLHGFDAGTFDRSEQVFTNGTGREVFAYMPRTVMPTVKIISNPNAPHQWSVDGTVTVSDVFIDVVHDGIPNPDGREWRTVLVSGLRRGGQGYFALDITQPDPLQNDTEAGIVPTVGGFSDGNAEVPGCLSQPASASEPDPSSLACHTQVGYPAPLWEFTDSVVLQLPLPGEDGDEPDELGPPERIRFDEDLNGEPDLAPTWSVPNVGRIRLNDAVEGGVVEKFVAVFGGGLLPGSEGVRGNWLYMVDIETGQVIYKARLEGSVPSEPAAVDTNQDGDLDRIYVGTTAGFMYRVDLVGPNGELPTLIEMDVNVRQEGSETLTVQQKRILQNVPESGTPDPWVPRKIFDTAAPISPTDSLVVSRPIFFRPSVIFVAELGEFALAFGTGDRENLWSRSLDRTGRFYVFVDETETLADSDLPLTEAVLGDVEAATGGDLLNDGGDGIHGWFLRLNPKERVVTNPFAVSGITFFSTFNPQVDDSLQDESGNPVCALRGQSRIFGVFTTNANGLLRETTTDAEGNETQVRTRSITVQNLTTEAFLERGQTQNPAQEGQQTSDALTAELSAIMEELKTLFPDNCKFGNFRIDVKTITSETGVVHVAPVPVCIIEKNWREF